jgi:hypothetical protein
MSDSQKPEFAEAVKEARTSQKAGDKLLYAGVGGLVFLTLALLFTGMPFGVGLLLCLIVGAPMGYVIGTLCSGWRLYQKNAALWERRHPGEPNYGVALRFVWNSARHRTRIFRAARRFAGLTAGISAILELLVHGSVGLTILMAGPTFMLSVVWFVREFAWMHLEKLKNQPSKAGPKAGSLHVQKQPSSNDAAE